MTLFKFEKKNRGPSVRYEDLLKKQINLLPAKTSQEKRRDWIKIGGIVAIVSAMIGLMGYSGFLALQKNQLMNDLATTRANMQLQGERIEQQKLLTALMNRIDYKSELIQYIDSTNQSAMFIIDTIERNLPETLKYVKMDFKGTDTIVISGAATDSVSIAKLIHNLKLENYFDEVFIESILYIDDENIKTELDYGFVLKCKFGGSEDETEK